MSNIRNSQPVPFDHLIHTKLRHLKPGSTLTAKIHFLTPYTQVIHIGWQLPNTRETFDVFDFEIRKGINDLDFVIGERIDDFPLPRFVGKALHQLNLEVGKRIDYFDFVVGKTTHELNPSVDFREINLLARHIK